jgi:hypothetical protein
MEPAGTSLDARRYRAGDLQRSGFACQSVADWHRGKHAVGPPRSQRRRESAGTPRRRGALGHTGAVVSLAGNLGRKPRSRGSREYWHHREESTHPGRASRMVRPGWLSRELRARVRLASARPTYGSERPAAARAGAYRCREFPADPPALQYWARLLCDDAESPVNTAVCGPGINRRHESRRERAA